MTNHNMYQDTVFFNNYLNLRQENYNYNDLLEQPNIFAMLGDIKGKTVLDIGCGYGVMDSVLCKIGVKSILAIDVSEMMLEKARAENNCESIRYQQMDMHDISQIEEKFDIIISSLAFHYIFDFQNLFVDIYKLLNPKGVLVFSIEHPMFTASKNSQEWLRDNDGKLRAYVSDSYTIEGERVLEWLDRPVPKYHHKMETIINGLINAGFTVDAMHEPTPTQRMIKDNPKMIREIHRPIYLIIRAIKD